MSDKNVHEIEQFYGCYLLCSLNEKFKGRTYIGFTVNPNRRIKQHNSGFAKGGAKRTSGKGPWEMVLIIHGFPNEISALRFEWAWQNPERSTRLKKLVPKTKHSNFIFKFSVVTEMLRIGPWCRLPLTVRWLKQEYEQEFSINKQPPSHMPIVYGPVTIVNSKAKTKLIQNQDILPSQLQSGGTQARGCYLCKMELQDDNKLKCIKCHVESHIICLSRHFLKDDPAHLTPIEGLCPKCKQCLLWGDLIRYKSGCYTDLDVSIINEEAEDDLIEEEDDDDDSDSDSD